MANLEKALQDFRKKASVRKDGHNPFFNSQYYQLEDILNALQNSDEYGIYWRQYIKDNVLYTKVSTDTESDFSSHQLPVATEKNHQEIAKQITYFRRIHLITMFGICEPDDDGNTNAADAVFSSSLPRQRIGGDGERTPPSSPTIVNEL